MWAAAQVQDAYPTSERLQVGDMSSKRGGPQSGHASHQNGLDADLSFYKVNRREISSQAENFDEHFADDGSNFDTERNWYFVKTLVSTKQVKLIFLDQSLKKRFCALANKDGIYDDLELEALRRVRHWPGHDNHLHIRLICPADSPSCINQVDPPEDINCGEKPKALVLNPSHLP